MNTKWWNVSLLSQEEVGKLLAKNIERTARRQLDGGHLLFGEYLQNWRTLYLLNLLKNMHYEDELNIARGKHVYSTNYFQWIIKQLSLNSAFVSSEELWRSQRVLSASANNYSDDTQPHSIIVKYPLDDSLSSPVNWHYRKPLLSGLKISSQKLHQFCSFLVRAAII